MTDLLSTFVVLNPDLSAATVAVTPTVWQELDRRFDNFKGRVLVSGRASFEFEGRAPRGTWHTAHIHVPTTLLFVTPGEGTQNKALT